MNVRGWGWGWGGAVEDKEHQQMNCFCWARPATPHFQRLCYFIDFGVGGGGGREGFVLQWQ